MRLDIHRHNRRIAAEYGNGLFKILRFWKFEGIEVSTLIQVCGQVRREGFRSSRERLPRLNNPRSQKRDGVFRSHGRARLA